MIPLGTTVLVLALKKHGVVTEIVGAGIYKVSIGALSIRLRENEITVTAQRKKPLEDSTANPHIGIASDAIGTGTALQKLDLHGFTVVEALRVLDEHISRAVLAGLNEVAVMHGVGSGKLHEAVHKHLATLPAVKKFQLNPYNRGVTRVFL